jgi:acyl-CoA thioester hydrolase
MLVNTTHVRVRYADTDKMGITYYSKYLEWFEVGRTEMLRDIGFPYTQLEKEGIGLPVIEVYCRYHRAAKYDQMLRIESTVQILPRVTIRIDYEIYNDEQALLVDGYTTHPFIGISGKPVRAPKSLLEALQPYFRADDLDLPSPGENGKNGKTPY